MIIINDDAYSNPYDESNDNKTKLKEWITKIIKVLLACVVIKSLVVEIIKLLIITVITVVIIIINKLIIVIYKILWKWCKVGNEEMQYSVCKNPLPFPPPQKAQQQQQKTKN